MQQQQDAPEQDHRILEAAHLLAEVSAGLTEILTRLVVQRKPIQPERGPVVVMRRQA